MLIGLLSQLSKKISPTSNCILLLSNLVYTRSKNTEKKPALEICLQNYQILSDEAYVRKKTILKNNRLTGTQSTVCFLTHVLRSRQMERIGFYESHHLGMGHTAWLFFYEQSWETDCSFALPTGSHTWILWKNSYQIFAIGTVFASIEQQKYCAVDYKMSFLFWLTTARLKARFVAQSQAAVQVTVKALSPQWGPPITFTHLTFSVIQRVILYFTYF